MAEAVVAFERSIREISLIPSDGGKFEVEVNGDLIYSKLNTGRHLDEGELTSLLQEYLDQHGGE
jgi:selenoprotein W-related protein